MATGTIKGITIRLGADATELTSALHNTESSLKSTQSQLNKVNQALKFDPSNVTLLAQKQQLLTQKITETKDKLQTLKDALAQMDAAGVEHTSEEFMNVERDIQVCESQLKTYNKELKNTTAQASDLGQLGSKFQELGGKLQSLGQQLTAVSVAATAVATAIGAAAVSSGVWADDLNTLSSVTGISAQQLQVYSAASDLVDVSVSTIAKSVSRLKKNMLSASEGTGDAADAFAALGVSVTNADGSLRNQDTVFQECLKSLGQMENETERDAYAMSIFGKSASELNPLIEDMGQTYAECVAYMSENNIPIVDQETLDEANTFNDAIDKIKMTWSQAVMTIGAKLAGYLAPVMETISEKLAAVAGWIANLDPRLLTIIMTIAGIVAAVAPVLIALGTIGQLIGFITTGLQVFLPIVTAVKTAFAAFNAVLLANPIGLVIAAIAALVAIFIILWNKCDGFREFWINLWEEVKSIAESAWQKIKGFFVSAWDGIKAVWNGCKAFFVGILDGIKSVWSGAVGWFKSIGSNIMQGLWNGISGLKDWVISKVKALGKSILNGLKSALGIHSPSKEFAKIGEFSMEGLSEGITDNLKTVQKAMSGVSDAMLTDGINASATLVANGTNQNEALTTSIVNGVVSALSGMSIDNKLEIDGAVVARKITPIINTNLGKAQNLSLRGV